VKLGDFGVSKSLANDMTQLRTNIDTDFTAPEIIGFPGAGSAEASSYTNAADLWSLGFLVHWLLTAKLPLTRREMGEFCIGALPSLPQQYLHEQSVTRDGINFILSLLHPQPSQRPSAYHMKEHKWLLEAITQTSPMPNHSIPEQRMGHAPQISAVNHDSSDKGQFAQLSPTGSTSRRSSPYPTSYVPYRESDRENCDTSYFPRVQHSPSRSRTKTLRPPGRTPQCTLDSDIANDLSSGKSFHTPLWSRDGKPNPNFQVPKKSRPTRIASPTTKEERLPSQLVAPISASAATPKLDAHAPQERSHSPASTDWPMGSGAGVIGIGMMRTTPSGSSTDWPMGSGAGLIGIGRMRTTPSASSTPVKKAAAADESTSSPTSSANTKEKKQRTRLSRIIHKIIE
jgi:serine/threonine protein kinase